MVYNSHFTLKILGGKKAMGFDALPPGERGLLMAVLKRALFDYFGNHSTQREDAREWLFRDHESARGEAETFSFSWICDALGLSPKTVRERLTHLDGIERRSSRDLWLTFCRS